MRAIPACRPGAQRAPAGADPTLSAEEIADTVQGLVRCKFGLPPEDAVTDWLVDRLGP
ncbi:hypothetical protein V4F39_17725 [Aquincola sp. MAHUQ-54]|uniref:Uncharacterized protein n=1 Tax=Aquincola agrisoli TaxID=3119538 RepID=A0AAW9QHD8_9BURK